MDCFSSALAGYPRHGLLVRGINFPRTGYRVALLPHLKDGKNNFICQEFCGVINFTLLFQINMPALIFHADGSPTSKNPGSPSRETDVIRQKELGSV